MPPQTGTGKDRIESRGFNSQRLRYAIEGVRMLTQERLKELLHYDPLTGVFTWKMTRKGRGCIAGQIAGGAPSRWGYHRVGVDSVRYLLSRLAFLYMLGEFPSMQVDHRDRNRSNNAWKNLRKATNLENSRNRCMYSGNTSGFKGVSYFKRDRTWRAQVLAEGKTRHLGYFSTPELAHMAYLQYVTQHHGDFIGETQT